jgi:hypothetical protein
MKPIFRKGARPGTHAVGILLLIGGLLAAIATFPSAEAETNLTFGSPVKVNSHGWGFEPSIDVDSEGVLYVTAHKGSATNEETRLASFLWLSQDDGATWQEMPSPLHIHDELFSFEGDLAVDAKDRLYFVDTFGFDTWLSRWSFGPTWDFTQPTLLPSAFDDRPWLAAHGDGIVYLLTTDVGTHARAEDVIGTPGSSAEATTPVLYLSTDGGRTWSEARAFPRASFCGVAASPRDDTSVTVACATRTSEGPRLTVHTSLDRGGSWEDREIHRFEGQPAPFPSVAYDGAGNVYTVFIDSVQADNKLYIGRLRRGTWETRDITPLRGSLREAWVTAGRDGEVGVAFYGSDSVTPDASSTWHVYAGVSGNAGSPSPRWSFARVDEKPVIHAPYAPPDFLQCVLAPDGTLFVAYSREATSDLFHAPPPDFDHDIFVARQLEGPNL